LAVNLARFKRVRWTACLLALAAAALGLGLYHFKIGAPLVNASQDWLFAFRGDIPVTNAVVVFLDEESHQQLRQPLNAPWDRLIHGRLLDRLTEAGARAVVMDIVFSDPSPDGTNADIALASAIKRNGRVVLAADPKLCAAAEPCVIPPIDLLRDAANEQWGLVQLAPSYDQVVRVHPPSFSFDKVSLSWRTARLLNAPITRLTNQESVLRWINYYGPANHLPHCSYFQVLDRQALSDAFFRDRIVFVGASTLTKFSGDRKDSYVTPFSGWVQDPKKLFIAGVEVQAVATLNLLRGDWLTRASPRVETAVFIVIGLLAGYGLSRLKPTLATLGAGGAAALIGVVAYFLFSRKLVLFPWLILESQVIAAWLFSITLNSIQLYVQKRLLEQSLSMYLSPKLVKKFAADKDRRLLKPGAEKQKLTILFSDIENFTALSERMDSDELAKMMNEYFQSAVAQCIHATDGTVVKYIGDAIFAFWNAPEPQGDHVQRACEAALRFHELSNKEFHGKRLVTRLGLHTGVANVGNFGSETRVDYTAIGESINLASRMEGLNKFLGTSVLVTGETKKEIGDEFVTRYLGRFQLKGFERSVDVHELVGRKGEVPAPVQEEFDTALRLFQQRDLGAAENAFQRVLEAAPDDGATKFYTKHIAEVRNQGVPEAWSGDVELKEK
jgi:adenylate cyclase